MPQNKHPIRDRLSANFKDTNPKPEGLMNKERVLHIDPSPQVGASSPLTPFEYPILSTSPSHPFSDMAILPSAPNVTVGSLKAGQSG